MHHLKTNQRNGFTLIELLIVIAIIGILASIIFAVAGNARDKADDTRIRNAVGQIRWMAEIAYNGQGGSYINWSLYPDTQASLTILNNEIDDAFGGTNITTIYDTEIQDYCVSAPLKSDANDHYCIDAKAIFRIVSAPCSGTSPLRCPSS